MSATTREHAPADPFTDIDGAEVTALADDPFLPDAGELHDELTLLWGFIIAPVDEARTVYRYVTADDFYHPTAGFLYRAAIEARRRHATDPATTIAEQLLHVMEAISVLPFDHERQRTITRSLFISLHGTVDVDPTDLRPHANNVLRQAMRRQARIHSQRVEQMRDEVGPDELFTAIAHAVTAMQASGLQQRYRALNNLDNGSHT